MAGLYWGEKSTYHNTIVHRVYAQLKRNGCTADFERSLVPNRVTDTFGYNKSKNTWYLCEIKVNWSDLQKAVTQIHETVYNFKRSPLYLKKEAKIVPVIAIPNSLYSELVKYYDHQWGSFCSLCKTNNIALWVVEQSTIRQIIKDTKPSATKLKSVPLSKVAAKFKPSAKTAKSKSTTKATKTRTGVKVKPTVRATKVKPVTKTVKTKSTARSIKAKPSTKTAKAKTAVKTAKTKRASRTSSKSG